MQLSLIYVCRKHLKKSQITPTTFNTDPVAKNLYFQSKKAEEKNINLGTPVYLISY